MCVHTHIYTCMYTYVCVICRYAHIYTYTCIYIYTCMYTHTHTSLWAVKSCANPPAPHGLLCKDQLQRCREKFLGKLSLVRGSCEHGWGFPTPLLGSPYSKHHSALGSILGPPIDENTRIPKNELLPMMSLAILAKPWYMILET